MATYFLNFQASTFTQLQWHEACLPVGKNPGLPQCFRFLLCWISFIVIFIADFLHFLYCNNFEESWLISQFVSSHFKAWVFADQHNLLFLHNIYQNLFPFPTCDTSLQVCQSHCETLRRSHYRSQISNNEIVFEFHRVKE